MFMNDFDNDNGLQVIEYNNSCFICYFNFSFSKRILNSEVGEFRI